MTKTMPLRRCSLCPLALQVAVLVARGWVVYWCEHCDRAKPVSQ